ncbi:hypothetical protein H8356DRAFT_1063788 [Neocallimastix lanati (nom. inval.)]|nr:hypothetical protein H8356DRAFT_1063788 [Neocallimastix sp. JGI-2020a]
MNTLKMCDNNFLNIYFEKQKKFVSLIKDVQTSLCSKEYKTQGYSFNEYIKMRWNISQAQAYRYLLCGRVLNQLEEFEIKPSYERLCKALSKVAKTPIQMKLLWSEILKKTGGRPDCINSTHINNIWKELCSNPKYSNFCKNEEDIMKKIEIKLDKLENKKKHKLINRCNNNYKNRTTRINNSLPSPEITDSISIVSITTNISNNLYEPLPNSINNISVVSTPIMSTSISNSMTNVPVINNFEVKKPSVSNIYMSPNGNYIKNYKLFLNSNENKNIKIPLSPINNINNNNLCNKIQNIYQLSNDSNVPLSGYASTYNSLSYNSKSSTTPFSNELSYSYQPQSQPQSQIFYYY